MKGKIAVISIIVFIIISLVLILIFSLNNKLNESNKDNITLRSAIKEGYTIDDMLEGVKKERKNQDSYTQVNKKNKDEDESLRRIQELIQKNEEAFSDPNRSKDTTSVRKTTKIPNPKVKQKDKQKNEIIKKDTILVKSRRDFLSARLVKNDEANAIKAFVHSTQTVMVGSTLKMQLAENCLTDDGQRVRKGTPVYGEVTAIDGERVKVKITFINIDNNILPFNKNVYSRDAMEGIYVPGNPKSETAQDAGAAAIQGTNMNVTGGLDLGTQMAAGAVNSVVNAAKSATSKNIRKIKVTIKTNYQILLMEDKE